MSWEKTEWYESGRLVKGSYSTYKKRCEERRVVPVTLDHLEDAAKVRKALKVK